MRVFLVRQIKMEKNEKNNLVVVGLAGGLGNQLFQYAAGRSLALKKNAILKLDISFYKNNRERFYRLSEFEISAEKAIEDDLVFFSGLRNRSKLWRVFLKYLNTDFSKKFYREAGFAFDKNVFDLMPPVYLDGYWQSEKYFKGAESKIRDEIVLKKGFKNISEEILGKIENSNSVSLHIRRGDYLTGRKAADILGVLPLDYYERAVRFILEKITDPAFFIFSDDIGWARDNLKIEAPTFFVSDDKIPDYEELICMSKCRHNIIANSSFSWWGAWLNNYKDKTVIAPQNWFRDRNMDAGDLIPPGWIKL